ncbi:glycogen/starch synthase, partial [Patescibacteria group bacterium]|nr:glycogen/starch synthase [Patescibacteria group bacterium]
MDTKIIFKKNKKLKLLYVSAEVYPYAGVGGLGQVSYFLTKSLIQKNVDARIFMPKYGNIDEKKYKLKMLYSDIKIPTLSGKEIICNIKEYREDENSPIVYFLENMEFYEKRSNVYGYNDDHIRFLLLSLGVMEFLKISDWTPEVINASDWHTGHIPNLIKTVYKNDPKISKIATIFSIHNIMHQGLFDHKNINDLDYDNGKGEILDLFNPNLRNQNFVRRGIMYADIVTTVSEKYSREILKKEYGEGLDKLLKELRT